MNLSLQRLRTASLLAASLALACQPSTKPSEDRPAKTGQPLQSPGLDPSDEIGEIPEAGQESLLDWIDPDAVGVMYWSGGENVVSTFEADGLVTLFGLPPRAEQLLRDHEAVFTGLSVLLETDHKGVQAWVTGESLAMLPVMARGTYSVLRTEKPTSELAAKLEAAGMLSREVEGLKVLEPTGSFVWRGVVLDDRTLAFVPASEVGSGLGPLTAARDLPASEIETQIKQLKQEDHQMLAELFLQGPMMHIDVDDPIGVVRFTLRRWQTQGAEGIVMMQPLGDPASAASALEDRDDSLETEQMKVLMDKVAFVAAGPVVQGRLQMPPEDLRHLQRSDL